MNGIFLRRCRKFAVSPGEGGASLAQVAMVQKETEQLGFVLSESLAERLLTLSPEQVARVLRDLRRHLAPMTGAHREHRPLFPISRPAAWPWTRRSCTSAPSSTT